MTSEENETAVVAVESNDDALPENTLAEAVFPNGSVLLKASFDEYLYAIGCEDKVVYVTPLIDVLSDGWINLRAMHGRDVWDSEDMSAYFGSGFSGYRIVPVRGRGIDIPIRSIQFAIDANS